MKTLLILLLAVLTAVSQALDCSVCGKHIRGSCRQIAGKTYCSEECLEKDAPECWRCGKKCTSGWIAMGNGIFFCSEHCASCEKCRLPVHSKAVIKILPDGRRVLLCERCAKDPGCYTCGWPTGLDTLPDGRLICAECARDVVSSPEEIRRIIRDTRLRLAEFYGYDPNHAIDVRLVSRPELESVGKRQGVYRADTGLLALCSYEYQIEISTHGSRRSFRMFGEKNIIYALTDVPRDLFIDALVHELSHDYLNHEVGSVKDLKLCEGFCQAMAADFNRRRGCEKLNIGKQNSTDPVYGEGFRIVDAWIRKYGFERTVRIMKRNAISHIEAFKRKNHFK